MDSWTKKKKAAESCGGIGMAKYIDSNENRRIARLKNVRSSIGSSMTQHSGWQKAQIEKRRQEQIKRRKQQAKKKPLGDGIKVDASVAVDYTNTGLKLKLDSNKQSANHLRQEKKPIKPRPWRTNDVHVPLPINPVRRSSVVKKKTVGEGKQSDGDGVQARLKALSLSSGNNQAASRQVTYTQKRKSLIPKITAVAQASKLTPDEGKENDSSSLDKPVQNALRASYLKKQGPKKHFQLATDLGSLKREHEDALRMLQDLDKKENMRRSLGSASTSYSFDSDESNKRDIFDKANSARIDHEEGFSDGDRANIRQDSGNYGELVSSSELEMQPSVAIPDESFAWLPDGIKDASHLSIVLNDEIESQDDVEYKDANISSRSDGSVSSSKENSLGIEGDGGYDYDGESGSSQSDGYLSDTSGY